MGISLAADSQTLDQSQLLYQGTHSARNLPAFSTWQSFTPSLSGTLSQIDQGFANPMSGTATLKIYSGTGVLGTELFSSGITIAGTGVFWSSFTISPPLPVIAEQVYTFEIIPNQGGGLPDPFAIQIAGPVDSYTRGQSSFNATWDYVFRTFVITSLGIENIEASASNINIYPNPFSSHTTVQTSDLYNDASLTLYNSKGQKVREEKNLKEQTVFIDRGNLSNGLYFLQIKQDGKASVTKKLIIID